MKNYILSIIVPVYNSENTIQKCLESIPKLDSIQIIIINDGSKDNSETIIKKFIENYEFKENIIYKYQDNAGVSVTRNNALKLIEGKYVCFLDSDDFYDTQIFSDFINKKLIYDFDLFLFGIRWITQDFSIIRTDVFKDNDECNSDDVIKDFLLHKILGYACNKIFKSELIRIHNLKQRTDINYTEDSLFFAEYLVHCKLIKSTSDVMYNYLQNQQSATHNIDIKKIESIKKSVNAVINTFDGNRYNPYYQFMSLSEALTMSILVNDKNNQEAIINILKEIKKDKLIDIRFLDRKYKIIYVFINSFVLIPLIKIFQKYKNRGEKK